MKKAALHNLGCKVNAYETEAMQKMLEQAGYELSLIHIYGNGTDVREMLRNGADDSLIEEKMREAVFFKPDGHEFGRSGKGEEIETKKMSQIGG